MIQQLRHRFTRAIIALSIVALATVALMPVPASAALITFVATGTVDFVDSSLSATFSPGQSFTMTYTFDSTTAPRARQQLDLCRVRCDSVAEFYAGELQRLGYRPGRNPDR